MFLKFKFLSRQLLENKNEQKPIYDNKKSNEK